MRIPPLEYDDASTAARPLYDEQIAHHGRMTNLKKTLGHHPPSLAVFMQWYTLREEVASYLGDRATTLLAHAISNGTGCLICGTFFRRILMDAGENPDELHLDERERLIVDFGRQVARDSHGVDETLFEKLRKDFTSQQIVAMTAFAGMMIATNVFNNVLRIELDEYLAMYRKS